MPCERHTYINTLSIVSVKFRLLLHLNLLTRTILLEQTQKPIAPHLAAQPQVTLFFCRKQQLRTYSGSCWLCFVPLRKVLTDDVGICK